MQRSWLCLLAAAGAGASGTARAAPAVPSVCGAMVYLTDARATALRATGKVNVPPDGCTLVKDGADQYLVAGSGHSWLGQRPPDGVDHRRFMMVRWDP